jgi:hypothetical protein
MKRYKYQALVSLLPEDAEVAGQPAHPVLPPGTSRMVIKAEHRETHASKLFSSLVTREDTLFSADDPLFPGAGTLGVRGSGITVTFVVLGDDACDYLAAGERFALWDGHDLGSGVVTRRIFV